jgi:hypothetical protein
VIAILPMAHAFQHFWAAPTAQRWNGFSQQSSNWCFLLQLSKVRAGRSIVTGRTRADPCHAVRRIPARQPWNTILRATYEYAEPGVLFIDTHQSTEQSGLPRADQRHQPVRRNPAAALWRQPSVDNSISKTINVPENCPFDEFSQIYDLAYRGCTTFRPNPVTGMILSEDQAGVGAPHC